MQEHKDEPLYEGQQEPGGELSATWQELLGEEGRGHRWRAGQRTL